MEILKILFWICLFITVYTYVGYGFLLYIMVCVKRLFMGKPVKLQLPADADLPEVTFMVCAYNEQDIVEMKMENIRRCNFL